MEIFEYHEAGQFRNNRRMSIQNFDDVVEINVGDCPPPTRGFQHKHIFLSKSEIPRLTEWLQKAMEEGRPGLKGKTTDETVILKG